MASSLSHNLPRKTVKLSMLDRPGDLRFHLVLLTLALALGVVLQIGGPGWVRTIFCQVSLDSPASVAALLLGLIFSLIVHELGHLYAALVLNYEVLGGALGPFRLDRWHSKVRVQFTGGNWARCSVSAIPRDLENQWRRRMMIVVGAGPMVSFLLLVAAARMALSGAESTAVGTNWYTLFWSFCTEINFFLVVLGCVPNGPGALARNDAALMRSLWRQDADSLDLFRCHQASELALQGIRPEDYPQDLLLELARFDAKPYTRVTVARRMVEWASHSHKPLVADEWDQVAVAASAKCSKRVANAVLAESACFDLLFREDSRSAIQRFSEVDFDDLFPPSLKERAWAAQLLASDMPERAPRHILRAQMFLPPGNPYYHYERMLLAKLHNRALRQTGAGSKTTAALA